MVAIPAHRIEVAAPGGPEVLEWRETQVPDPGTGEVRITQAAVGLNFIDVYHRTGLYPLPLPFTPGVEGAGTIESVGEGVEGLQPGDRVAYAGPSGAYAQARTIPADRLLKIPDGIGFEQAAAMMLKGLTAQVLLRQTYRVEAGDTILVHAAAGGVGLILCQWASALGATVIGTVSTPAKAELARAHGCAYPIVTGEHDFVDEVMRITKGAKLPVVYDSVGRDTFLKSLDCLRPRGLMVSFGQASGAIEPIVPTLLAQKGSLYLTRPTLFTHIAERPALESAASDLFDIVASGEVSIEVNQRFPLANAADAHRALEERRTTGSSILFTETA